VLHVEILVICYCWNSIIWSLDWSRTWLCHLIHFVHVLLFLIFRQRIILLSGNSSIILSVWIHWISYLSIEGMISTHLRIRIVSRMRSLQLLSVKPLSSLQLDCIIGLIVILLSHVSIILVNFISDCLQKILVY